MHRRQPTVTHLFKCRLDTAFPTTENRGKKGRTGPEQGIRSSPAWCSIDARRVCGVSTATEAKSAPSRPRDRERALRWHTEARNTASSWLGDREHSSET